MKSKKKIIKTIIILIFILSLFIIEVSNYGERGITKYNSSFKIFDMQWNYTVNSVYESLNILPVEGIKHYMIYLLFDTIMTLSFAGVQHYIAIAVSRFSLTLKILNVLIALRVFCDLIENISIMFILKSLPITFEGIVKIASVSTKIKLISLTGFWILVLCLSAVNLYNKIKKEDVKI